MDQGVDDGRCYKGQIAWPPALFKQFSQRDYGLDYYAAFVGCSAETEASFGTIAFLAQKMDELGCDTIFTIENSDASIARSVVENTRNKNAAIAVLDSAQSVTSDQINSGTTYLSIMEKNYDVLKEALE